MTIGLRNPQTGEEISTTLPASYWRINNICETLKLENTVKTQVEITEVDDHGLRELLENKVVKLDEINFFAKKLKKLQTSHYHEFMVVAKKNPKNSLKDLINLTQELSSNSNKTDYYNGKQFPFDDYEQSDLYVKVVGEYYDEFIYLPSTEIEIAKATQRLGEEIVNLEVYHYFGVENFFPIIVLDSNKLEQIQEFYQRYRWLDNLQKRVLANKVISLNLRSLEEVYDICYQTENMNGEMKLCD